MEMILVIGAPGQGKSPFAQKMIEGRRCLVFDVNDEYGTRTKYPGQTPLQLSIDAKAPRARYIGTEIKVFTKLAMERQESVIVMEEATAFFRGAQTSLTSRLIIGRRHTRNTLLFLFHSINRVPPEIMELTDWVVLFKTNDEVDKVQSKYHRLIEPFLTLRSAPKGTRIDINMME